MLMRIFLTMVAGYITRIAELEDKLEVVSTGLDKAAEMIAAAAVKAGYTADAYGMHSYCATLDPNPYFVPGCDCRHCVYQMAKANEQMSKPFNCGEPDCSTCGPANTPAVYEVATAPRTAEEQAKRFNVRSHSLSETEERHATSEEITKTVRLLYKDQQVYTHVDVFNAAGERLLFRVTL